MIPSFSSLSPSPLNDGGWPVMSVERISTPNSGLNGHAGAIDLPPWPLGSSYAGLCAARGLGQRGTTRAPSLSNATAEATSPSRTHSGGMIGAPSGITHGKGEDPSESVNCQTEKEERTAHLTDAEMVASCRQRRKVGLEDGPCEWQGAEAVVVNQAFDGSARCGRITL